MVPNAGSGRVRRRLRTVRHRERRAGAEQRGRSYLIAIFMVTLVIIDGLFDGYIGYI